MNELQQMLKRQAQWQKDRACLTWAEKIRMVEAVQKSIRQLRARVAPKGPEDDRRHEH